MVHILVTTAESRTGEGIVNMLLTGAHKSKVTVSCTFPTDLDYPALKELGAKVISIDVESASADELAKAMKDVDCCVMVPAATTKKDQIAKKCIDAALQAKVPACVLVSSVGVGMAETPQIKKFAEIEKYAKDKLSGKSKTVICRAGHYAQNLYLYAKQMKELGYLGLPIGDGKFAPVDARDAGTLIAELAGKNEFDKHDGQTYTLTGPESMSGEQIVKTMVDNGLGDLKFRDIPKKEAETYLKSLNTVDESEIGVLAEQFELVQKGKMDFVSNDFKTLTGQQPRTVTAFIKESINVFKTAE